jgi:predicted CoA-substrate-specific enzyme activase
MEYYTGIDIGSVSVKLALINEDGKILELKRCKIISNPRIALNKLLSEVALSYDLHNIKAAGVSGNTNNIVPSGYRWTAYTTSLAIAAGVLKQYPDARTIINIGGQGSHVIELQDGLKKPWKVATNPLCAAGTGRFIEQQAYRLGIDIRDFGELALKYKDNPPRIAARCSVFAKSDLIHLQQKGVSVEAMLSGLCLSIARQVVSLKKGEYQTPVYFTGGVAENRAIVLAMEQLISERNSKKVKVNVPENFQYVQAIGSAILSIGKKSKVDFVEESDSGSKYLKLPALPAVWVPGNDLAKSNVENVTGYLGVDVGSTSTKAVIVDESGNKILAKNYLMTAGKPVDAVKQVFSNLIADGADKIIIAGAGVTGSGRYLIGSLIGADLIKNEITAQTRAAEELDKEADIIEIGGQDSKLVIKRNGVVIDYQMNKACAAGTGSFIDEMAEMLGISVKDGQFAKLALKAEYTIDLGTRCASFMGQAVPAAQSEGYSIEVITASLANSIAKNYLSKVVGERKLGDKVILTGAVFYNEAVVAAFNQQLPGKQLLVAEHREVSGAIGAALLAKELISGEVSKFKGFNNVIKAQCKLSTFICNGCDNNCAITQMKVEGEKPTFYGSRCDKYDAAANFAKKKTAFDDRENLLFSNHELAGKSSLRVGVPRSLLVYDYAPLLIGFLNSLGVNVVLSGKTNQRIIEKAIELAYTDSCFPVKLLHGHTDSLRDTDFILFPSAIRLGIKEKEENQKYTCPLIQASPFIINHVLELKDRLLIPFIDFSHGEEDAIRTFSKAAKRMGFSFTEGRKAASAGIKAQKQFEHKLLNEGEKLLEEIHESGKIGVVILSRSYMSQDAGANLGVAEKLAQLDVVPIPLDYLPVNSIDVSKYTDRPYWSYEQRMMAAADIIVKDPQLFGLALTNFGCGPNSFILKELEDIMGSKPMGQLEIDEHAAEAGLVTRIEAYVDTIKSFASAGKSISRSEQNIYRGAVSVIKPGKKLIIPRMAPHADVLAAAMRFSGVNAVSLPEPDERNLLYSNEYTSGTECLPYRVTLGDFLKYCNDNKEELKNGNKVEGFMSGSYGPCRMGKYAIEQIRILRELGFHLPIRTTVSNNAYRDLGLGSGFERTAWRGFVAVDYLQKMLWRVRPYEKEAGAADKLFEYYLAELSKRIEKGIEYGDLIKKAINEFKELINRTAARKPLVGINGEIFLRSNRFSNRDLVKECEKAGLEVVVSSIGEWFMYTAHRNVEDAVIDKKIKRMIVSFIKRSIQQGDQNKIAGYFKDILTEEDPTTAEILRKSGQFLSSRCGSEAVLSLGSGIDWMESPEFSGVISIMPHGCMPGGIVAAMAEKFSAQYQKPWINLTYDGFMETNNATKIQEFAELVKFCQ